MENKIVVVGIGPGSEEYLLPIARKAIDQATVIVGGKRAVETLVKHAPIIKYIDKDIQSVYCFIKEKLVYGDITVLVSGDPGFYSLLAGIRKQFSHCHIEVIPGISSMQLAFARIAEPWQDAMLLSMHGREVQEEKLFWESGRKVAFLTDAIKGPCKIAQKLLMKGWPADSTVWLCENLSYEHENVISMSLGCAANLAGFEYCVMVVKACDK